MSKVIKLKDRKKMSHFSKEMAKLGKFAAKEFIEENVAIMEENLDEFEEFLEELVLFWFKQLPDKGINEK